MADPSNEPPNDPEVASTVSEIQRLIEEIRQLKARAEEQSSAAEAARQNADSEALFAFNAKRACEEHSTAIAALKGTADSDVNAVLANKQKSDEVMAAVNNAKAAIDSDQKVIDDHRKEVDRSAQEITKGVESAIALVVEIEGSKESAESTLKSTKEALASALQAKVSTEEAKLQVEKFSSEAATLTTVISENQESGKKHADELKVLLSEAQKSDASLKEVWEHLLKSDETARANEAKNDKHSQDLDSLTSKIESLLPGATSAGLASSFNVQKERFNAPQRRWLWTFVCCMIGLVLVALPSFIAAAFHLNQSGDPTWDATWRNLAVRLPIVLPLVWLAIYAGRNYMLSLRLEEDYAYKEAISTAFEGYKREMEKITTADGQGTTPLTSLCTNVLRAIAERPGRIYEGKHRDINLASEALAVLEKGAEFSKKQIAGS
jgi:hypothetical protein